MIETDNIPVLSFWQPGYEPWSISKTISISNWINNLNVACQPI
jgi:hypothetical protein